MSIKERITPKVYFEEMRQVSNATKPVILDVVSSIKKNYPQIGHEYSYYFKKRINSNKLLLRPFIFKQFLDMLGVDWKEHLQVIALVEIVNISTYQSNLAFDGKDGVKTNSSRYNQFIASIFSKLRIYESINSLNGYDENKKLVFSNVINESFEQLYYGQYLDINELVFSNSALLDNENLFNESYSKRCTLLGSSLIEMIGKLALCIADVDDPLLNSLVKDFSIKFGRAGQVVNDLGDIAENGKSYSLNQFSDLSNERLTLPLRFAISKIESLSKKQLRAFLTDKDNVLQVKEYCRNFINDDVSEISRILSLMSALSFETDMLELTAGLLTKSKFIA